MRKMLFLTGALVCLVVSNLASAQTAQAPNQILSAAQVVEKLAQAKQELSSRNSVSSTTVILAALDPATSQLDLVSLDKTSFLTKAAQFTLTSQHGRNLLLSILRPNGVNTAVTLKDITTGRSLMPLMVRYPIQRAGAAEETAFYASAHPALISDELVSAGRQYVETMLQTAAQELAVEGVNVSDDLITVAEHLVLVEHTDHRRFLNEDRSRIYPEILSLYALNRGDTFRYSVSSAGAGGMIQMIPRTYDAIREHHPNIGLDSDFVAGMQNHANALKAMLLYIDDTWRYLSQIKTVQEALSSGLATKEELLAAGYNSNPYRLASYLTNGGAGWRTLIPAETQMYLAIYQSVDGNVNFVAPGSTSITDADTSADQNISSAITSRTTSMLVAWMGRQLLSHGSILKNLLP